MRAGTCIHFTGIQHTCCKADVNYRELADGSRPGMALRLPCWSPNRKDETVATCVKYTEVTPAQLANQQGERDAAMDRMRLVLPVVAVWRKKAPKGKAEMIECPACQGRLHLSQSSYNGHVHGQCETAGCVSWME